MLEVIYQDDHCIAINKPSGMLVHRSWLDTNETIFVMQLLRNQIGQHVYPVHRLDRPTSGVLLFAKDSQSARLTPKTGRKHQLRQHMKHIFHPIIGDTTYGDKVQNRAFLTHLGTKRLLLHAHSLTFNHPITQQPITITAPLDEQFWHVCSRFGWCDHDKITPVKQVFW